MHLLAQDILEHFPIHLECVVVRRQRRPGPCVFLSSCSISSHRLPMRWASILCRFCVVGSFEMMTDCDYCGSVSGSNGVVCGADRFVDECEQVPGVFFFRSSNVNVTPVGVHLQSRAMSAKTIDRNEFRCSGSVPREVEGGSSEGKWTSREGDGTSPSSSTLRVSGL